jgi:predicted methyltransferase
MPVEVPDDKLQRAYRVRISLFLIAVCLAFAALVTGYEGIQTLSVLEVVERERDRWQRADRVLAMLNVKAGCVVADIGSGAGYFTFKLAPIVGEKGGVLAEDILKKPLAFLWVRARLYHVGNVHVIYGTQEDPHLPERQVDAVLIANTYHEFMHSRVVLKHVFYALRPTGRLVIIDRGPLPDDQESREFAAQHHERNPSEVEVEIREVGFELVSRDDGFIGRAEVDRAAAGRPSYHPDNRPWWLIVARRP